MKPKILLSILLVYSAVSFAQKKSIGIHVDVLGAKNDYCRYYHPIEGVYEISDSLLEFDKKQLKKLKGLHLIQPIGLVENKSHIQANSLRYHIDPNDLLYVNWGIGRADSAAKYALLDSFAQVSESVRKEKYQQLVMDYFNPFFIKRHEVTNYEYREFVFWVRDSLFREEIYKCDSIPKMERLAMLDIPDEVRKYGIMDEGGDTKYEDFDPFISRGIYSFKQDINLPKMIEKYPFLKDSLRKFYLDPNERWFKRREIDVKQFKYKYYTIELSKGKDLTQNRGRYILEHSIPVYPDTLVWVKGYMHEWNDAFTNMYFWHPAYDNYPVVGISYEQALAFCDWKEKMLRLEHPEIFRYSSLGLPRLYEYEWALMEGKSYDLASNIQDNHILTDLDLGVNKERAKLIEKKDSLYNFYTNKVWMPCDETDPKCRKQLKLLLKRFEKHAKYNKIEELMKMRAYQNHLINNVDFLSNNVSEWMDEDFKSNYQELAEAYLNYNCLVSVEYCEDQRNIDYRKIRQNDQEGKLILGSNWFDERYENVYGVNVAGIHAKTFQHPDSSFSTVGFRYVIRLKPTYYTWNY
ncbi:SUMF1/EgtB/PvdO family nonheme iron enzyme [Paracrocinitomix mangrovi]|uniref:SUMF1/EgtB/PvdO family nonheme iron enzyme n=1 Tax=Paracrocinitomix mangrovi TaxID=2862509 RepID=UPI001C8D93E5|nr:SUMF1/EgtB/PvdO family nonheme iron enzyme [Paracrocinitomix mangrovi]UKN00655.1 SUMF1/EgtB/PvdO family nonheme iron enzyme [Paracrocinitomix mangrovi]